MTTQPPLRFLLALLLATTACGCAQSKPTRGECIVKVTSSSPATMRFREGGLDGLMPAAWRLDLPMGGYRVADEATVYLQFDKRCQERGQMAEALFRDVFPKGGYVVSAERIKPGRMTIELTGPAWNE